MKVNNFTLVNMMNNLKRFGEKKLPQKISYAIMKNIYIINKDSGIYEKSLQKIIDSYKDYFVKDEILENGLPKVDDEHMEDYITEINELLAFEVDIDLYYIDEDVFDYEDSDRYDSISAADLIQLRMIICKE